MLSKITKVICYGSSVLVLSSCKVQAKELVECHDCHMRRLPKAKELPLYVNKDQWTVEYDENSVPYLEKQVASIRNKVSKYTTYVNNFQNEVVHIYETGVAHSKSSFEYLKDEENKIPRVAAIISGGLLGLVLARKGGIIKKVLYTSLGTGGFFTAFYPEISKKYIAIGWESAKGDANQMLVKYGGYDTDKIMEDSKAKFEQLKKMMMFESLTNKLKDMFQQNQEQIADKSKDNTVEKSSNQDMYTTRSA